jgi:hypothetical protein
LLEIGAGAGNLAYFLTLLGRVRSYTIVDLPQMLIHAGYTVQRRIPRFALHLDRPPGEARTFTLISDFRATELMHPQAFDAAINMNSFHGNGPERARRLHRARLPTGPAERTLLQRRSPPGRAPTPRRRHLGQQPAALSLSARRRGAPVEEDSFQTATRVAWGKQATLTVTRAARIHPAASGSPDVPVQPRAQ